MMLMVAVSEEALTISISDLVRENDAFFQSQAFSSSLSKLLSQSHFNFKALKKSINTYGFILETFF